MPCLIAYMVSYWNAICTVQYSHVRCALSLRIAELLVKVTLPFHDLTFQYNTDLLVFSRSFSWQLYSSYFLPSLSAHFLSNRPAHPALPVWPYGQSAADSQSLLHMCGTTCLYLLGLHCYLTLKTSMLQVEVGDHWVVLDCTVISTHHSWYVSSLCNVPL